MGVEGVEVCVGNCAMLFRRILWCIVAASQYGI